MAYCSWDVGDGCSSDGTTKYAGGLSCWCSMRIVKRRAERAGWGLSVMSLGSEGGPVKKTKRVGLCCLFKVSLAICLTI